MEAGRADLADFVLRLGVGLLVEADVDGVRTVAQVAMEVQGDPWCMGVYIENELSWGNTKSDAGHFGLVIHTLSRNANESPAKSAFVEILKNKYSTAAQLSQAWSLPVAVR